jgi:hypothetical protein
MAWWQNEAGEPMYSPEQIRAEEQADLEREPDIDDDYRPGSGEDDFDENIQQAYERGDFDGDDAVFDPQWDG